MEPNTGTKSNDEARAELGYDPAKLAIMVEERYHGGLRRYISQGVPPGHFLSAVLKNDLFGAMGHADNPAFIDGIVKFLYNYCDGRCHGSPEKFNAWISVGGAMGLARR